VTDEALCLVETICRGKGRSVFLSWEALAPPNSRHSSARHAIPNLGAAKHAFAAAHAHKNFGAAYDLATKAQRAIFPLISAVLGRVSYMRNDFKRVIAWVWAAGESCKTSQVRLPVGHLSDT
jgi:hypothetical protein